MLPADTARAAILGVPLQVNKLPERAGTVRAIEQMQAIALAQSTGIMVKANLSALNGVASAGAGIGAWVVADSTASNNGLYENSGTSESPVWTRRGDLPYGTIKAINVGAGTANAIVATSAIPIPSADGAALIILPIVATNDVSPVTVAFNGGAALTIKSNTGNDIAIDGLQENMFVVGMKSGSTFRLISDQVDSAIIAQAEAWAVAALGYRNEAETFKNQAEAAAASIQSGLLTVFAVATTNLTLSAPGTTIDGRTMTAGETFIAGRQSAEEENGIYLFNGSASAATRLGGFTDFDAIAGQYFSVMAGDTYAESLWRCTSDKGGTIDSDPLRFEIVRAGQGVEFETVAAAEAYEPVVAPEFVRTAWKATAGDGLGGLYDKVASEPSSIAAYTYADGGAGISTDGSAIGNLTGGGGLAAAFDVNFNQTYTDSARNAATPARYIGRTFSTPKRIWKALCYGSNDQGFIQSANPSVTIYLYGKTGAPPANATDGTLLGSATFTDRTTNFSRTILAGNTNMDTLFDHAWVYIQGDGTNNIAIAELRLYEAARTSVSIDPETLSITTAGGVTTWYDRLAASTGHLIAHERTGASAELVTSLPIANPTPDIDTRRVIFSIPVYVEAGDLLEGGAMMEHSTNEGGGGANVGVWSGIILTPNANGVVAASQDYEFTETNGRNVTPNMHHDTHAHPYSLVAPATGLFYVNYIAYAANTSATGSITVEGDYGHLSVKRTRGHIGALLS